MSFEFQNRKGSDSAKWDKTGMLRMVNYVDDESLPLWIADMDFKTVPLAIKNLAQRMEDGIYGYPICKDSYYEAIQYWYSKHFSWDIKKEWIVTTPGMVPAITYIVQTFTNENNGIIIQEPVYYPFRDVIEANNRVAVNNNLLEKNGHYTIDFDDLLKKAQDPNNKIMILCSPHNPIGRVWTKEEITKIAQICLENDVLLCSDEIYGDLILGDNVFETCGNLDPKLVDNTIICTAPSKTFNLSGLRVSNIIISNEHLRESLSTFMEKLWIKNAPSILGAIAVESVYTPEGEQWLKELTQILESNLLFVKTYLEKNAPNIKIHHHQGTYLVWLDLRETGLEWNEIERKMEEEAKVVLDLGSKFGESGRGFMRMNIACHISTLTEALKRIVDTYQS